VQAQFSFKHVQIRIERSAFAINSHAFGFKCCDGLSKILQITGQSLATHLGGIETRLKGCYLSIEPIPNLREGFNPFTFLTECRIGLP